MVLCEPGDTDDVPDAINVRTGTTKTLVEVGLDELKTAAGPSGMVFKDVLCNGSQDPDTFTLNMDGSGKQSSQPTDPAANIEAAFNGPDGFDEGDFRVGLRAVKHTSGGVTTYYIVGYGAPKAGHRRKSRIRPTCRCSSAERRHAE